MTPFRWTGEAVAAALGDQLIERVGAPPQGEFERVSTDTRTVRAGDLFVALAGENFDAHDFLAEAADAGAAGLLVEKRPERGASGLPVWVVENTLHALGRLGRYRRRAVDARVVCITGTNGKTTTKDLVRAALSPAFKVHATAGNLNNQIGVPLTLLAAPDDAEVLVVEIGTNEPGEIATLTAIAEPDAGIITAVGEGHLEKLGSVAGVLAEKTALVAGLPPGSAAYVAELPPSLPETAKRLLPGGEVQVAGFGPMADLTVEGGEGAIEVLADGTTRWSWGGTVLHLPLRGRHNVRNALLALGLARDWGVTAAAAAAAIERMPAPKLRGEWRKAGRGLIIADCYNSNPPSLAAAVDLLVSLPAGGDKVVVVGTMRELGAESENLHGEAAAAIRSRVGNGVDRVVATGSFVPAFPEEPGGRIISEPDPLVAWERLAPLLRGDETILLKASRGEALERLIPLIENHFGS